MSLKQIDLTTALRPSLYPDEVLLFVQDNVGLYEGKYKIPGHQNGHAYLTSHRICYVDNEDPRKNSVGIDLKDVESFEYYGGFLKSSPKITLVPKITRARHFQSRTAALSSLSPSRSATASTAIRSDPTFHLPPPEPAPISSATWICPICTFSNPLQANFDPTAATVHTPLPPCLACGIKPPLQLVLKAAISSAANRPVASPIPQRLQNGRPLSEARLPDQNRLPNSSTAGQASFQCPRCTFLNHPSLMSCELCGAPLLSQDAPQSLPSRIDSPGPMLQSYKPHVTPENTKLSFRSRGSQIFHERLKSAMTQRKWLVTNAPPVPKPNSDGSSSVIAQQSERTKTAGIAGLEQRRREVTKNNEVVIGSAFEDLEALMASAKEIVALAESFARQTGASTTEDNQLLAQSANALGLTTTKDMLSPSSSSQTLYLTELSRNLAEFLTDDRTSILRKNGGVMTLVDLWAVFNRARNGIELVSPTDFRSAVEMWEKLRLPVRLRRFRSGVLVVQGSDRTDEKTVEALLKWLGSLHLTGEDTSGWDRVSFGEGVTARDVSQYFGWSIGVAEEELEMAEARGAVCRDEAVDGCRFWENFLSGVVDVIGILDEALPVIGGRPLMGL